MSGQNLTAQEVRFVAEAETEARAGTRVGECYEIQRLLGRGGMGTVYLARDLRTGDLVALKTLRSARDADDVARFEREIRILEALAHPRLVAFRDHGQWAGVPYFTMEYLRGRTLAAWTEAGGPLPGDREIAWFVRLIGGVLEGLEYLHEENLVHRDLKPGNVMVLSEDEPIPPAARFPSSAAQVKIMDLGLVLARDLEGDLSTKALGTLSHASPEQIESPAAIDDRSDLYSLGVILYQLLTRRLPFERLSDLFSRRPPPRPRSFHRAIPEALEALVLQLLSFEPYRRPASAEEVREALRRLAKPPATAAAPSVPRPKGRLAPAFVGREKVLAALRGWVLETARGRGAFVRITGERGVGKTALLARSDLRAFAALQARMTFASGRFDPSGPPHSGLRTAFGSLLDRIARKEGNQSVVEALGPWGRRFQAVAEIGPWEETCPPIARAESPEVAQEQIVQTALRITMRTAARAPLLLVLEEIEHADDVDLEILRRLALATWRAPILLIATDTSDGHAARLIPFFADLKGSIPLRVIELGPMEREEIRALARSMLSPDLPLAPRLEDLLLARTDGIPLYTEHLVNSLWDRGLIRMEGGAWTCAPAADGTLFVPESARDRFALVLSGLGADARCVLEGAAVLGVHVDFDALRTVTGIEEDRLASLLRRLVRAHVLEETSRGIRFHHPFERDIAYEQLPTERRRALHTRAGTWAIDAIGSRTGASRLAAARHFDLGGDPRRAAQLYAEAAREAARRYALRVASDAFERALALTEEKRPRLELAVETAELLGRIGDGERALALLDEVRADGEALTDDPALLARVLVRRGLLLFRRGEYRIALASFVRAAEIFRRIGDREGIAATLRGEGAIHANLREFDRAAACYEELLALQREAGNAEGIADALGGLGLVHKQKGELSRAAECYDQALESCDEEHSPSRAAKLLNNLANVFQQLGDHDRSTHLLRRSIRLQRRIGDRQGLAIGLNNLARGLAQRGDYRGALRAIEAGISIFEEIGDRKGIVIASGNRATFHFYLGEFDAAEGALRRAASLAEETGNRQAVADASFGLAEIASRRGEADAAEGLYGRAVRIALAVGDRGIAIAAKLAQAALAARRGREGAVEAAGEAVGEARADGRPELVASALAAQAEILLASGRAEAASEAAREATSRAPRGSAAFLRGRIARILGAAFRDLGPEWADRTEKHFDEAIRTLEGIGARHELGLALLAYGQYWALIGEREEAAHHLRRAADLFGQVGAGPDRDLALREVAEVEP
ncbi:MAG: tetratricopeptide repeat protein [Planctomycetes bacterium]|nr:tetratricopeptide repeat protein [Planctomycetota bacterium]